MTGLQRGGRDVQQFADLTKAHLLQVIKVDDILFLAGQLYDQPVQMLMLQLADDVFLQALIAHDLLFQREMTVTLFSAQMIDAAAGCDRIQIAGQMAARMVGRHLADKAGEHVSDDAVRILFFG